MPSIPELQLTLKNIAKLGGEERTQQFNQLKANTRADTFLTVLNQEMMHGRSQDHSNQIYGSYIAYAIMLGGHEGLLQFIELLITSGAHITGSHLVTKTESNLEDLSLIHVCARMGAFDLFKHLNEVHGLQITTLTGQGKSILDLLPVDLNVWRKFIPFLKSKGVLNKLCSIDSENHNNIFNQLLKTHTGLNISYRLYQAAPQAYRSCIVDDATLHALASYSLMNPEIYPLFIESASLRLANAKILATTKKTYHEQRDRFNRGGVKLELNETFNASMVPGMKLAIDDFINHVLRNRANLKLLLAQLEYKLNAELALEGIKHRLDNAPSEYTYRYIGLYKYPVPNEHYQSVCKQSTLERVLISILQDAGMGQRARKWYGLIPEALANKMIHDGDFFIESQFGIGVLHGKFSHMIQWALLILAIKDKFVRTEPGVTAKSIIQFLISHNEPTKKTNLFAYMIDIQYTQMFTLQDPYRLTSLISTGHFHESCPTLEAYLRDAFCSGFLQWVNAFNTVSPTRVTPEAFSVLLGHSPINQFIPSEYNRNACVERVSTSFKTNRTHKVGFFEASDNPRFPYALIEKDYSTKKKYKQ